MQTTDWKAKTIIRSHENKQLKKRIKELTVSRDRWKVKAIYQKERSDKLSEDLKKIKDRLNGMMR